jgi:hypothetical protein
LLRDWEKKAFSTSLKNPLKNSNNKNLFPYYVFV